MAKKSFHLFPRLPTKLRLQIGRLCLPYRVRDPDWPTDEGIYLMNLIPMVTPTAKLNGLPPVITRVCQESRNVAKESGGILTRDAFKYLPHDAVFISTTSHGIDDNFWRDSAHLNWTPFYESIHQNSFGSALASIAWRSRLVVGRPSIMGAWVDMTVNQNAERFDVFQQIPSWWVIMHVVIIHTSFREAAQLGLFGLLGDASAQTLSLSDRGKIKCAVRLSR
ncbi:hypothetical protein N7540_005443 [Penicillium herquei]|nr:hypothetical protein N7540_005443 [Penicillium herquei]